MSGAVRRLALLRRRSERLERPNAHLYETGAMRRTHLRGHTNSQTPTRSRGGLQLELAHAGPATTDFTLCLLNDGSTDGTLRILHEMASRERELVVIDKPDSGHGQACVEGCRQRRAVRRVAVAAVRQGIITASGDLRLSSHPPRRPLEASHFAHGERECVYRNGRVGERPRCRPTSISRTCWSPCCSTGGAESTGWIFTSGRAAPAPPASRPSDS